MGIKNKVIFILSFLLISVRAFAQVAGETRNASNVSIIAGGTNTYTATISPSITSYSDLKRIYVVFTNGNTGAATLNINSIGAVSIKKNVSGALATGDILAGQAFELYYDGTNFQILGSSGNSSLTLTGDVTGTGSGTISTTLGAGKVTNSNLAGSIDDSKLLNQYIYANGSRAMTGDLDLGNNNIKNVSQLKDGSSTSNIHLVNRFLYDNTGTLIASWGSRTNGFGINTTSYNAYLKSDNQTANRTFQFPDKSGTFAMTSDLFSLPSLTSGSILFSNGTTLAQDNANFYYDAVNHRLGLGLTSPASILHISESNNATIRGLVMDNSFAGTSSSKYYTRKSRSGGIITTGDVLGNWTSAGHDGTQYTDAADIRMISAGTISTGIIPGQLSFRTATTAGTLTQAFLIDQTQNATFSGAVFIAGTGGLGYANYANQSSTPATPASGFNLYSDNSGRFSWIGTNGFVRTFDGTSNTASRTYTLPDYSGTVGVVNSNGSIPTQVEEDEIYIQGPVNKTYPLISKKIYPATINGLYGLKTSSGTCTVAIQINGTNITGLSSISVTSTPQDVTSSALNSMNAGDRLTIVVTSASAPTDLECVLKVTR